MADTAQVFVPTRSEYEQILENKMESILSRRIPQIIRQANRKPYLTTKDFKELFGVSFRMQKYYRDECDLEFIQEGRKIIYETETVETFMEARKVNTSEQS